MWKTRDYMFPFKFPNFFLYDKTPVPSNEDVMDAPLFIWNMPPKVIIPHY